jgi:tetratricopeptide (TPR) repeat protein
MRRIYFLAAVFLLPLPTLAQRIGGPPQGPGLNADPGFLGTIMVVIRDETGSASAHLALVSVYRIDGGLLNQGTAVDGQVQFDGVKAGTYIVKVTAAGYQDAQQKIELEGGVSIAQFVLRPLSDATAAAQQPPGLPTLSPKAQKLYSKVVESLRASNLDAAGSQLQQLYRLAPGNPDVNYLYGLYESEKKDWPKAKDYWQKTLGIYPKHVGALLQLSQAALYEKKPAEAMPYLERAAQEAPTSWRPHAMKAQALFEQGQYPDAVKEADRALELGHSQAINVQPLLAQILVKEGDKQRAIEVLQNFLKERADDIRARKFLDSLLAPPASPASTPPPPPPVPPVAVSQILNPVWKPADVDESMPAVQPGVPCWQENVLHQAARRTAELVKNLDRFTATELLKHEVINAAGVSTEPEKRKFNYVVSISEVRPGFLAVEEYRGIGSSLGDFPDELATLGLPALVLVFHPFQAGNFNFVCEGLAHTSSGLAWQVHFQPKPDRIPNLQTYTVGGRTLPIPLKGRAWIAADSFQVVRLESDLVRPLPQVRLNAEHTVVEYGPVRFRSKNVSLWLPQSAEVYFDWHGKRIHRRHSYSDYLLFSVDDKQRNVTPKSAGDDSASNVPGSAVPASQAKPANPPY